jgi:hypothetical protein
VGSSRISNRTIIAGVALAVFLVSFILLAPRPAALEYRLGYGFGQGVIAALVTWLILRFALKRP